MNILTKRVRIAPFKGRRQSSLFSNDLQGRPPTFWCSPKKQLGQSWLEEAHASNGNVVLGTTPTLRVAVIGQQLAALEGIARSERLIEKIRRHDVSAEAELAAIYLVRYAQDVEVELEPPVEKRVADFRVREKSGAWIYVEVTFPDWSKATERAQTVLGRVAELVHRIKKHLP